MKAKNTEAINIAFIADSGYALPLGVAISSLKKRRDRSRAYFIYVISDGIEKKYIKCIKGMEADRFRIDIIKAEEIASYKNFERTADAAHVSPTALYKFDLADIFKDKQKLLYLDCDIIVMDSLTELYDTDIEDRYAAVIKDIGAEYFPAGFKQRLGISHSAYFNSGVMLLNPMKMSNDGIPDKLLEYRKNEKNDYMDQDAFNVVLRENVKYVSFYYNMALSCWRDRSSELLSEYYSLGDVSSEEIFLNSKILHLSAAEKPWISNNVIASEAWLAEFISSPMTEFELLRARSAVGLSKLTNGCDYEKIRYASRISPRSDAPDISVITPVYNSEEHLPSCIESLMCQTYGNAEFIIVDDGSTDGSIDIIKHYAALDGRIKLISQSNSYAGAARNNGMLHASGKYMTFLDSDDIFLPNALRIFIDRAMAASADIVISSAYHFSLDPREREIAPWCLRGEFVTRDSGINAQNSPKYLFQITAGAPWGKFFLSSFIRDHGITFPCVPRAEDTYFTYLSLSLAESISVTERATVLYRNNKDSNSLENAKDRYPTEQMTVKKMLYESLVSRGIYGQVRQSFINNVINTVVYHFRTFKTYDAFSELYNEFKNDTVPFYGINMNDPSYFYVKGEYDYAKVIYDSRSPAEYFYELASVYKAQADRHWRALMRIQRERDQDSRAEATNDHAAIPDYSEYIFLAEEAKSIRSSASYRIGRMITYIPRKIRGLIRIAKRHGILHALALIPKRLRMKR